MKTRFAILLLASVLSFSSVVAAMELPAVFASKMVLQRDQAVPVWGTAKAGETITVFFGGQEKSAVADVAGNWRVDLAAMKASAESRTMTVRSSNDKVIEYSDVLVGEVWFAGGQSNMYRPFRMLTDPANDPLYEPVAEYLRNERDTANDPLLRQYRAGLIYAPDEAETTGSGVWTQAIPGEEINNICATAYFFARELRRELGVPVALISCNKGGTNIEAWMPQGVFENTKTLKTFFDLKMEQLEKETAQFDEESEMATYRALVDKRKQAIAEGKTVPKKTPKKPEHPMRGNNVPGTLYNGMVHPIAPYAMRGVIWYQGESNSKDNFPNDPKEYGGKLVAMVDGWRSLWGQKRMPFYWCQLANYKTVVEHPVGDDLDGYAWVQYGQREAMDEIPDSGMAVLNDIGEAKDIHPKNKVDAGKRISLWALNKVYGKKDLVFSGPLYKDARLDGNKIVIRFDHVGSGLMTGHKHLLDPTVETDEALKRFQICAADGKWKWAEAKIVGKDTVAVWHQEINSPIEVRYAWAANPKGANLYNKEGLPASLFKTGKLN